MKSRDSGLIGVVPCAIAAVSITPGEPALRSGCHMTTEIPGVGVELVEPNSAKLERPYLGSGEFVFCVKQAPAV